MKQKNLWERIDWTACTQPWSSLTIQQQQKFEQSYLNDAARAERMRVFSHAKTEPQHRIFELLHTYQKSRRERHRKERLRTEEDRELELKASSESTRKNLELLGNQEIDINEFRRRLREGGSKRENTNEKEALVYIRMEMFKMLLAGDWETIRLLAEYGETHCKEGIRKSCNAGATGGFPAPAEFLADKNSAKMQFSAVILRVFAESAGIEVADTFREPYIQFPENLSLDEQLAQAKPVLQTANQQDRIPVNRHLTPPPRLPSKAKLREAVMAEWKRLGGKSGANMEKEFSRRINTMGLGGLCNGPRGVKAAMRSERAKVYAATC